MLKKHSRSVQISLFKGEPEFDDDVRSMGSLQYRERRPQDFDDFLYAPSYTRFHQPYYVTCSNRILQREKEFEAQFQHELAELLDQQPNGYEAARFVKHLAITSLWPPYHSVREITKTRNDFFNLTPKQRTRLNYLMSTKII